VAVVSEKVLPDGPEVSPAITGLPASAQSQVGEPYQSQHLDFWETNCQTDGLPEGPIPQYRTFPAEGGENSPLFASEYRDHYPLR